MDDAHVYESHNPPGWNKGFQWLLSVDFGITVWAAPASDGDPAGLYGDICNHEGLIIFTYAIDLDDGAFNDLMVEQHRQDTIAAFLKALEEVDLDMWHAWQNDE